MVAALWLVQKRVNINRERAELENVGLAVWSADTITKAKLVCNAHY
jgi:hypothetical protein